MFYIFFVYFLFFFFFFNDTATTEIYTLSLHDALPISDWQRIDVCGPKRRRIWLTAARSEEHTSELQSRRDLVCRLLLEKKKRLTHSSVGLRFYTKMYSGRLWSWALNVTPNRIKYLLSRPVVTAARTSRSIILFKRSAALRDLHSSHTRRSSA